MIAILKLINNVEVVGEVEVETTNEIILKHPLQVNYRYYIGAMPSVSFVKYSMFSESDSISFSRDHIINQMTARPSFAKFYEHSIQQYCIDSKDTVDEELLSVVKSEQMVDSSKQEFFTTILESMSIDDLAKN
jgi:hypothetical protein